MKLTGRFLLSHGALVVFTLLVSFALLFGGARRLLDREMEKTQQQALASFTLAATEAALQQEDVAVMNFMRFKSSDRSIVFSAYRHPKRNLVLSYPATFEKDAIALNLEPAWDRPRSTLLTLKNGVRAVLWYQHFDTPTKPKGAGWVALAYSEEAWKLAVQQQSSRWTRLGLLAAAAALLLGGLLSWVVARQLVKPLKQIRDGTRLVRSGQLGSLVAVNRADEIGDLARDFNSMTLQLKDLDEMKRDFVAGVTHDLGTPLHAIRSASNYLQAGDAGPVNDKQSEYLLMISNATQHLITFINNLLTVSRIEAAQLKPYFEPVDVMAHASELVTLYQSQAREKGVDLKLTRKVPYISLVADVTMFRQIVMNLISNALKFTSQGSIEVVLNEADGDFVLEVRDTGIGVDPSNHLLIFDRFFRVKQPKDHPAQQGSGLGLSIVKGLVEAHGGRVTLESALGKGSCFFVRLPKQPRSPNWFGGKQEGSK